jgi:hypothetical protein
VISATFVIGAVLAAVAGIMWAANYGTVQHTMGFLPGLKAFTAPVPWWAACSWAWWRRWAPATWAR